MIKVNMKIGAATVQVEAETEVEVVNKAGFWGSCPKKCGACGSVNIGFFSRMPSGNLYVGMECDDCHHTLNFGQAKEGGRLFVKQGEPWSPPYRQQQSGGGYQQQQQQPANNTDDIPY